MRTPTLALTLAFAFAACSDEDRSEPIPVGSSVDGGTSTPSEHAAATPPDAATPADDMLIPLVVWVDDLIDHRTNESAPPDTVEDKRIRESEEQSLFDKYFE